MSKVLTLIKYQTIFDILISSGNIFLYDILLNDKAKIYAEF